jgi:asparagine synthase (glutamine-hydrolysing)
MCGICGIFYYTGTAGATALDSALDTLSKRGPEVKATYCRDNVALGHSRLSIIDTTEAANQPFSSDDGRYTLIYNGEIYNFRSLRDILIARGVTFHTQGDTEVLLHWLITHGPQGITDLQGFFAFALFDKHSGQLMLARDRFGIKPLLYYRAADRMMFASEMKAMIRLGIPKEIDRESLQVYFQLNYIPGPWSIYRDVLKLMPGYYMLLQGNQFEQHQYYQIPLTPLPDYNKLSYQKTIALLKTKMEEAVVKRLVSDVPLGAFLSGGIDSSIIVALAAKHVDKLQTFSIGFKDEPMFDETHYARSVAQMHNTHHTEFSLTTNDLLGCLYDVLDYTDEPFADSSALAVYVLSRETRSRVTVALSGDGADEIFAGYNKHMAHLKARSRGLDAMLLKYFHPVIAVLPQSRNNYLSNKIRQLHRFGKGMRMTDTDRYWRWAAFADQEYPSQLLLSPPDIDEYYSRKKNLTRFVTDNNSLNGVLLNDMHLVLTNDMLTKVDMMSMANSLEVRVPFLDHEVVNLGFSMAERYKIDASGRKKILKDAFREMLPAELYHRPKQGFEVPLLSWFRKELKSTILNEWMSDEYIREQNIFNPEVINKLKKRLFSPNPGEIHAQIWSIIVFQHWYEKFHSHN